MSTLADPEIRKSCCDRLARLTPDTPPKWGRMTAPQMICHLTDSFRVGTGEKQASSASSFLSRTVMKWFALRGSMKWPQGVPTRPEVEQGRGGTPPTNWDRDRAELRELIQTFADREKYAPQHPTFGSVTPEEWKIWGYRHVDHHFRQFGL